ncbi:MAG: hypothetical protein V4579_05390 [Pseudomonadota bacterium]
MHPYESELTFRKSVAGSLPHQDIFAKVFNNTDLHRQNNVASELYKLEEKLFGYGEKQKLLRALQPITPGPARPPGAGCKAAWAAAPPEGSQNAWKHGAGSVAAEEARAQVRALRRTI